MILIGLSLFHLYGIFYVKKIKIKQVVYYKKVFPSVKKSFLKEKSEIFSSYIF